MVTRPRPVKAGILFRAFPMLPGETVEGVWSASVPWSGNDDRWGRLPKHGGNLLLTNQRLLFEPLRLPKVGPAKVLAPVLDRLAEDRKAIPLADLTGVVPFSDRAPPRLRIALGNGEAETFIVLEHRMALIWNKGTSQRDDAIRRIATAANVPPESSSPR